jgi:hypothetical protein
MTEDEARALLRNWGGDGLEAWLADQSWHPTHGGWEIEATLLGWTVRIAPVSPRLRLRATPPDGRTPATWTVGPLSHPSAVGLQLQRGRSVSATAGVPAGLLLLSYHRLAGFWGSPPGPGFQLATQAFALAACFHYSSVR